MKIVKGNKTIDQDREKFLKLSNKYDEVILDIGTGDGRYVFKNALENPNKLYIGIDTLAKQMEEFSKKARKNKLENAVFIIGSVEHLPGELNDAADIVNIILPWGSLLKNITNPQKEVIGELVKVMKMDANLEIILGYDPELEPSETARLGLPTVIDDDLIQGVIAPKLFEFGGLELTQYCRIGKRELESFETTWSKKLTFGKNRPIFSLTFKRV